MNFTRECCYSYDLYHMKMKFTTFQRPCLWLLALAFAALSVPDGNAQLFKKKKKKQEQVAVPARQPLQPGQFEWQPQKSPSGPLLIVVSIDDQVAYVYRNGVEIGRSTVSTGRPGKETPTGVFTILEKKKDHESSIYKGAKMPNMQRLTWSGIAIHAGDLPGYPASAGCIRLPLQFSSLLFEQTALSYGGNYTTQSISLEFREAGLDSPIQQCG